MKDAERNAEIMNSNTETAMFKALADDRRITILKILCSGEKCANAILDELEIGQPTLSHHMKILCGCGLINARKDGKHTYYSIDYRGSETFKNIINELTRVRSRRVNSLPDALL